VGRLDLHLVHHHVRWRGADSLHLRCLAGETSGTSPLCARYPSEGAECSLLLNAWYLDDGTLIGETSEVEKALSIIREGCVDLCLGLNLQKCELWWPIADPAWSSFPVEISRNCGSGSSLLGSAVGGADSSSLRPSTNGSKRSTRSSVS
jgi:hypothetical protein